VAFWIHALATLLLGLYALHQAALLLAYFRRKTPTVTPAHTHAPMVTIQLPLFNERYAARRVIEAVLALDHPRELLEIQVLDDSVDDTRDIAREAVIAARARGFRIDWIPRRDRTGFKAGALAHGLERAQGAFVAIFDADFVPAPDFLRNTLGAFEDPSVGFVQTRWDYLNRDERVLTRAQALVLDVHFLVEQPARASAGVTVSFNGSGGIWRRRCIDEAGGWHADTLTEDLDLSYRAALLGWRGCFRPDYGTPGELPDDVLSYKRQQARWARGSLQTARKLLPAIWVSGWSLTRKLAASFHLTGYLIHPLILTLTVTTPLLLIDVWLSGAAAPPTWVNLVSALSLAPILSMGVAHVARGRGLWRVARDLPAALMLGVGVSFSNSAAMLRALIRPGSGEFVRTPKRGDAGASAGYRLRPDWTMWIELGLSLYAWAAIAVLLGLGHWAAALPLALYACAFGAVWWSSFRRLLSR
jgi:cellulose synthase/poly-beta-1,6-N-acetylglucosamine synthase-like glycosyltransferase